MKTRAQFLLVGLLSIVPLFKSLKRDSCCRPSVEEEAAASSTQRLLNSIFSADKEDEIRLFQSKCEYYSNGRSMTSSR
jgi:hypothetical protein